MSENETLTRSFTLERGAIDSKARAVEMSFSSALEVDRGNYIEVLDHSPDAMDLSRLNSGAAFLVNHDPSDQVGVVERAEVIRGKGRARVRFGHTTRAKEIWEDVKGGIRSLISVGYDVLDSVREGERDGKPIIRVTKYLPLELSLVSIPADPTVGIGRSKERIKVMTELESSQSSAQRERDRCATIAEFARGFEGYEGVRAMADRAIASGMDASDAKQEMINLVERSPDKLVSRSIMSELPERDRKRYSVSRAILGAVEGNLDGMELEMHRELERSSGRATSGVYVPMDAMARTQGAPQQRTWDAATSGAASQLVGTDNMGSMFIDRLRPRSIALGLGVTRLDNLTQNVTIPRLLTSVTASWEGEVDQVPETFGTVDQVPMAPNRLSASTNFSLQLLRQGGPSVDGIINDDIQAQFGTAIDSAIFEGSGTGNVPAGISAGATGSVTITVAGNPDWDEILEFESDLATANADMGSIHFVTTPPIRRNLKQRDKGTDTGMYVWTEQNTVNGYQAHASNNLAANRIIYGNFRDVTFGSWGGIEMIMDNQSRAREAIIQMTAHLFCDVALRQGASFVVNA